MRLRQFAHGSCQQAWWRPVNLGKVGKMRVMKFALFVVTGLVLAAGCATRQPLVAVHRSQLTPALLFDRCGGVPSASQMALRSDWPSAPSLYQRGESIFYRERFTDIQRAGPSGRGRLGYTYRRFDTVREGAAVR